VHRRAFLRSAAAVVPALGLHDFLARAQEAKAAAQSPKELHVVGAGEDRFGHPHSLGISTMCFKVSGSETGGSLFLLEHSHLTPGGPALHQHWSQEEWFYVSEGEVTCGFAALGCCWRASAFTE
jgi:hypothetical protein